MSSNERQDSQMTIVKYCFWLDKGKCSSLEWVKLQLKNKASAADNFLTSFPFAVNAAAGEW